MKTTTLSLILIPLVILSIGGSVGVNADDGDISASDEALQNSNGIKNVFMVYLCGDNNLAGSAESDIQEMIAAGGSDNILAIIVLWDKPGSAEDGIYDITASGPVRVWAPPGEINTADPAVVVLPKLCGHYIHGRPVHSRYMGPWERISGCTGCVL